MAKTPPIDKVTPTRLQGKTALITGATRGIGLAIAESFAREGMRVAITGRVNKTLASAKNKIGKDSVAVCFDVQNEKQVIAGMKAVKKAFGGIDYLINNAGTILPIKPLAQVTLAEWNRVIETNLTGMFLTTKHALPLVKDGGVIVNVLSVAARQAFPGSEAYCASKFGGVGFTESLRLSLRADKRRIRVVALYPGAIETELWDTLWPDAPRERMLKPETVAQLVTDVLRLPEAAIVENLHIGPADGEL